MSAAPPALVPPPLDFSVARTASAPHRAAGAVCRGAVVLQGAATGTSADESIFSAASLSKCVIAIVALQCCERGEVGLDDDVCAGSAPVPVRNPAFPDAPVTLRHLLCHRSGLRDDESALHCGSQWRRDAERSANADSRSLDFVAASLDEYVDARLSKAQGLWSPAEAPGQSRYHYSNLGMTIAAAYLQRRAGCGFAQLAKERVFAPLAMHSSSFTLADLPRAPLNAVVYGMAEWPAAGLRTTLSDLLRLLAELTSSPQDCRLLSPASVALMLPADGRDGLAWWGVDASYGEKTFPHGMCWTHGGFMEEVRTHIYWWPAARVAAAVLQTGEDEYESVRAALFAALDELGHLPVASTVTSVVLS